MRKIFGIGLSKTGTTSLSAALNELGIKVVHYPKSEASLFNPKSAGACDIPVAVHYKILDKKFPYSKFIYTVRNKDEWMISTEAHFKHKEDETPPMWQARNRVLLYGQLKFDKDIYSAKYDEHDRDVRNYFRGREQDLLILNICAGGGWNELLTFLEITNSTLTDFPHKKKKEDN